MTATLRVTSALKTLLNGKEEVVIEAGRSVRESLISLNITPELIALVIVNGDQKDKDYVIQEEDNVKVLAIMGGG